MKSQGWDLDPFKKRSRELAHSAGAQKEGHAGTRQEGGRLQARKSPLQKPCGHLYLLMASRTLRKLISVGKAPPSVWYLVLVALAVAARCVSPPPGPSWAPSFAVRTGAKIPEFELVPTSSSC